MTRTTCIRNADWVIPWDDETQGHKYLQGADVAFTDDAIIQVGGKYQGAVDEEIAGGGVCVMPGLIKSYVRKLVTELSGGVWLS